MSLIRTALRLQAIETLNSDPVILSLVQGRVFDSRISALDHREPVPVILVTTEETKGEAWSKQNGGSPFGLTCDLILEIAMNAISGEGDDATINYVGTDRELEASLDLIEERAVEVLTVGETSAAQMLRAHVVKRVPRMASSRFATDQTGEKLAIRLLTITVELLTYRPDEPFDASTGPYAAFPEPLRTLAPFFADEGSARRTCDLLAAQMAPCAGVLPAPLPFAGIGLTIAPHDIGTPPDRDADVAGGAVILATANP